MKLNDFIHDLTEEYGTAEFVYNDKKCGVEPEVKDSAITYCMWYGDKWKDYSDKDELLNDPFFNRRSLTDVLQEVVVSF